MTYTKQTWTNSQAGGTPLGATRMTHIEDGVYAAGFSLDVKVASADMPAAVKASADFVCDGTADQTEINAAIVLASALQSRNANSPAGAQQRGRVQLSGGRFDCSGSILLETGVTLAGMGRLTEVRAVGITAATGSGTDIGLVKLARKDVHLVVVRDLFLNGNYASGGDCSGIAWDMTSSTSGDMGTYPSSSPDADLCAQDLFIDGFSGGTNSATRSGVRIEQATTTNMRGTMLTNLQIRNCGQHGIWMVGGPDSHIRGCHVGTIGADGYRIDTSNMKIVDCKAFYCDGAGFNLTGNRSTFGQIESQDNYNGIVIAGDNNQAHGLIIDTADATGISIAGTHNVVSFSVFCRSGGRYGNTNTGYAFSGSPTDLTIHGDVNPSNVTAITSGSAGARTVGTVTNGTSITYYNLSAT